MCFMKKLSEADIEHMSLGKFIPDEKTRNQVRAELHLLTREYFNFPTIKTNNVVLDLHNYTEEQAWTAINELISNGVRTAKIITGASGILKIKFQQWAQDSIISKYFVSITPINNGSFSVKFRKKTD